MQGDYHIRDAGIHDIPGLIQCAVHFFEYAKYSEIGMHLDKVSFAEMVCDYIERNDCKCLVVEKDNKVVGSVCGVIVDWPFNRDILMAYEAFYWMEPEHRGKVSLKLLSMYEEWVESYGAINIMIQPETSLTEKVGKLYEKRGYQPLETFWVRKCR